MKSTLQSSETPRLGTKTRRKCLYYAVCAVALSVAAGAPAVAQMGGGMGGGMGQGMGSGGRGGMSGPDHIESPPAVDKPDAAAKKFYNAGVKSLKKATEFEAAAAAAPNEDKRNAALEKKNDFYGRALDQFTAALSNQGDLYDAWNNVGYIHLQLGAYAESVDDYNHTLAMKPDLLEAVESVALPKAELCTSWLYQMTHAINTMPSLYLEAGAIHGCVLCKQGTPVCYTEDVGRHNAVDKIAGWIYRHGVDPADKILYTTGRLTSEMIIKTVRMGIPILVSRSGFTAWGVELARQVGLTLVGRAKGKRFIALSGQERIVFDQNLAFVEEESARHKCKGEDSDD